MCIFRHDWGKWVDTKAGYLVSSGTTTGTYIMQEKRCEKCGKVRLRRATA